jgi:D-methionine transport system substrate-binding protein
MKEIKMKRTVFWGSLFAFFLNYGALNAFATEIKDKIQIVIGTTTGDFAELVKEGLKPALEKKGYRVKLVEFTDYVRPNLALGEGSLDVNIFQHKPYLQQFAKEKNLALTPIAEVPTAPLGLYAGKTKTLAEVKEGSAIGVPNDPTNLARALVILSDLNWVTLSPSIDPLRVTIKDITANPKKLKFAQLEAAQLPRALADLDFAVINGNYATGAGIALTSALSKEKSDAYINVAVVKTSNVNAPFAKEIAAELKSEAFQKFASRKFAGYKFPAYWKAPIGEAEAL